MTDYTYTVTVEAASQEQADTVMQEKILPDEDYGFPYAIGYTREFEESARARYARLRAERDRSLEILRLRKVNEARIREEWERILGGN